MLGVCFVVIATLVVYAIWLAPRFQSENNAARADIPGLPPDPGEEGKKTLAGIDSDNDGVRDDVQRWIELNARDSARYREALKQKSIALQRALLAKTKDESIQAANAQMRVVECIDYIGKLKDKRWGKLTEIILNTKERNAAYDMHQRRIDGQIFHGVQWDQSRTSCKFNVESLPD